MVNNKKILVGSQRRNELNLKNVQFIMQMREQTNRFYIVKPRWHLPDSAWWFTVWGGVAALITFLFVSFSSVGLFARIIITAFAFLIAPLGVSIFSYGYKLLCYIRKRLSVYDDLYIDWLTLNERLSKANETVLSLGSSVERKNVLELKRVHFFRDKLHVFIKKRRGLSLEEGQLIVVIDISDGLTLGYFRVSEVRQSEYLAQQEDDSIDPLWLGFIKNTGESEMYPPAGSVGLLVSEDIDNND